MKHIANCTLVVEDKTFLDKETGNAVEYTAVSAIVNGEEIRLSVKKEDRSLLRVLRREMDEVK